MTHQWKKVESAPMDIWCQKTELNTIRKFSAELKSRERKLFFEVESTPEQKQQYIDSEQSFFDALEAAAASFGNKVERTITILDGKNIVETWKRTL